MTPTVPARRPIRRLSARTVERIAAGEVVERPASVVKELVENAIDAGATSVTIRLEGGGLRAIEVADNGAGIPSEELELAVERHATSKLPPDGPVDAIGSLGFRGEALAAIASVSRFHLLSRPVERELAEGIPVVGGKVGERYPAPRAVGTTVEVGELFFNTPARRKFLKSPAAEQLEVVRTVERLYVARPSVAYRVEAEGREIAALPSTLRPEDAAARVLGPGLLRDGFAVDGPVPGGTVRGVLGRPTTAASTSAGLYLVVNGRAVASRALTQSVRAAFADHLPRGRFPVGVLHLEVEPTRVDVNVHPTKREVRFAKERELVDAVRREVRRALLAAPQLADLAPEPGPTRPSRPPDVRPGVPDVRAGTPAGTRPVQARLDDGAPPPVPVPAAPSSGHPSLVLLGCLHAIYWVAESEDGLVLIDQHAASERVVYETLRRDGRLARQALVTPVALSLTSAQAEALRAHEDDVRSSGFEGEAFGPSTFRIRTVPSYRGRRSRPEVLLALLDELADGGRPVAAGGLEERTAASVACHAAIRAGDPVEPEEFRRVLRALYELPASSYSCPHGRPIFVRFPRTRLDRWFLRSGT